MKQSRAYMQGVILFLAVAVAAPEMIQAQGTIYVSNLGLTSTGSVSVGSDLWVAEGFQTGTDGSGYLLNSVQLALTDASGNPNGFTAMIYDEAHLAGTSQPGSSLGTLNGSLDPVAGGIYTYTPASNLTLSPSTHYFIVLSAGTAVTNSAYEWSVTSTYAPTGSDGWRGGGVPWYLTDGLPWRFIPPVAYPQLAVSATVIPEPGVLSLFVLGGFLLVWHRRKAKAVDTTWKR